MTALDGSARPRSRAFASAIRWPSSPVGSPTRTTRSRRRTAPSWCAWSAKVPGLLAIDRENEYLNTVAAADAGVGAAVIDYLPERSLLVLEFIEGDDTDIRGHAARRPARLGRRRVPAPARCAPVSATTSTCSTSSAGTSGSSRTAGSGCRTATSSSSRRCAVIEAAMAVRDEGTVPCNNDLLAENFIDVGDGFRLIDYEYSGIERRLLRARQHLERVESVARPARRARGGHYYGRRLSQQGRPGPPVGAHVEVRLDALGVDPGRRLGHRLRLLDVGDGEVRPRGRRVRRLGLRPSLTTSSDRTERPRQRGAGVGRDVTCMSCQRPAPTGVRYTRAA